MNNAYLYASKEERERMNTRPYYCQSAVVFLLICLVFVLNGLDAVLQADFLSYIAIAVIFIALVYAILSSIWMEKRKEK